MIELSGGTRYAIVHCIICGAKCTGVVAAGWLRVHRGVRRDETRRGKVRRSVERRGAVQ